MWYCGPIMPPSLFYLLVTCDRETQEEDEEEEDDDDEDEDEEREYGKINNVELDDLTDSDNE